MIFERGSLASRRLRCQRCQRLSAPAKIEAKPMWSWARSGLILARSRGLNANALSTKLARNRGHKQALMVFVSPMSEHLNIDPSKQTLSVRFQFTTVCPLEKHSSVSMMFSRYSLSNPRVPSITVNAVSSSMRDEG